MSLSDVIQLGVMIVTAIGVLYSIYKGVYDNEETKKQITNLENQLLLQQSSLKEEINANSNLMVVKKAEFTNEFVKQFRSMMPGFSFCSDLSVEIYKSNAKLYKLFNDLSISDVKYEISHYTKLLQKYDLTIDLVDEIIKEYRQNINTVIKFASKEYLINGLSQYCDFYKMHNTYRSNISTIENNQSLSKEEIKKEINSFNKLYVHSIFMTDAEIYNDYECVALSVQFGLIDYEKITNLIYAPLMTFSRLTYIRLMQSYIKHDNKGIIVYSNIISLYNEIMNYKKIIDSKREKILLRKDQLDLDLKNNHGNKIR